MTVFRYVLSLIEKVQSNDQIDLLNEIDARVDCIIKNREYIHHEIGKFGLLSYKYKCDEPPPKTHLGTAWCVGSPLYSRSRDALKVIRSSEWHYSLISDGTNKAIYFFNGECFTSPHSRLPTEELAELHAIIQVMEYIHQNKT